ncbi:hypothetical protein F5X99DRAFT_36806 [Biscogniauxia marginata]|nr:hypothetical protein F5X99DRAFT_36806 [Biscogniauxia marginata]
MEQVFCSCIKCNQRLSQFLNLWTKIGKSYISPIVQAEVPLNVVASGEVRLGEAQTVVVGCQLQDIKCTKCSAIVGLKCTDTPVNHVLHTGQLLLRISSILVTNIDDNTTVTAIIQRTLKLREPSSNRATTFSQPSNYQGGSDHFANDSNTSPIPDALDLTHLLTDLDAQREEIQRLDSAGYQIVATFNQAVQRMDADVQKLRDGMTELQRNLGENHAKTAGVEDDIKMLKSELMGVRDLAQDISPYERLENEISTAKQSINSVHLYLNSELDRSTVEQLQKHDAISSDLASVHRDLEGLRKELDKARNSAKESISTSKAYAKEVISLKAELKQLREEMAHERSQKSLSSNPIFPSREIDILTSNITKIGQRASQVETLQMEFDLLKGRVQRMEAQSFAPHKDTEFDIQTIDPLKQRSESLRRKRSPDSRLDEPMGSGASSAISAAKRPALDARPNSLTRRCDSRSSPLPTRTPNIDARPSRLTKAGVVDKRTLRRGTRRSMIEDRVANG